MMTDAQAQGQRTELAWLTLQTSLRRWLRARVSDDATADDLLQTVFLRVHERGDQLGDADRLTSWVWQIARNALIDHRRTQWSTVELDEERADLHLRDDSDLLPDELAGLGLWVAAQIDALPPEQAAALRLTELQGLTMREAAAELGVSVSGVKSRVQRGRVELRRQLLRCCAVELDHRGAPVDFRRRNGTDASGSCDSGASCSGGC